jgi:fructan beta-fructosidase
LPLAQQAIMIGWVNNWNYADDIPVTPWKGAFSLPRNISIKKSNEGWILLQRPLKALEQLRSPLMTSKNFTVNGNTKLDVKSSQFEMHLNFHATPNGIAGVRLAVGNDHYFEIGYDAAKQKLYIDRSKTANQNFNKKFQQLSRYETVLLPKGNNIELHIYFDNSIVEIFANDGEAVMTSQIFPAKNENDIELFSNNPATFSNVTVWQIKSAWQ